MRQMVAQPHPSVGLQYPCLSLNAENLVCLEDVGAVLDAVLHEEDEDGDEGEDEHVQRVHALPEPRTQVHLEDVELMIRK